jgi:hypothetical protein
MNLIKLLNGNHHEIPDHKVILEEVLIALRQNFDQRLKP